MSDWWRQAVVYQIYHRSFADANGDGIGDLKGITSRVPYLRDLGIDAIWLSPFYPSALKDGGYDVADYRDVDPRIGTLADFDDMIKALTDVGINFIVDIVPNHSSDDHPWFKEAVAAGRGSKERARYHFHDGMSLMITLRGIGDEPPNDWQCFFGGSAWEWVGDGQWYFHLFDSSQPDFNWSHQDVKDDFLNTLRFWGDRGVAGFRVDVAATCAKDMSDLSIPYKTVMEHWGCLTQPGADRSHQHPFLDRDEIVEVYREWRKVFNEYTPHLTAVGEIFVAPDRTGVYAAPDNLGQAFSFDIMMCNFAAKQFESVIKRQLSQVDQDKSSTTYVLSNHDAVRHATRYGLPPTDTGDHHSYKTVTDKWLRGEEIKCDVERGRRRAIAATMVLFGLPGSTYIYQGEELGLLEVVIPHAERQDPEFLRGKSGGRDGCRVPLPWTAKGNSFGFNDGDKSHLPQPKWFADYAVDKEDSDPTGALNIYRKALHLRQELQGAEKLEWVSSPPDVLHFKRPGGWQVICNFGITPVDMPKGRVVLATQQGNQLQGESTAWLL